MERTVVGSSTSFGGFELGGEEREGEPAVLDHRDVGINAWPSVLIFHLSNISKGEGVVELRWQAGKARSL